MAFIKTLIPFVLILAASTYFLLPIAQPLSQAPLQTAAVNDIPKIGLGTWLSEKTNARKPSPFSDFWDEVSAAVEYALKLGYKHIDAASIYGNEKEVGQGIKTSGVPRDSIWITSKLWNTAHRPEDVQPALEKTLSDLGIAYLDLYLMHWPVAQKLGGGLDDSVNILQTWVAMEDLVRKNLTVNIGTSNFAKHDVEAILGMCKIKPYAHEFETHPYLQQQEFVDWHQYLGIKVIAYSPLANTNPTYHSNLPSILDDQFFVNLANRKNATTAQTVLAWGLRRDTIVIPKSVHKKYIAEDFGALKVDFTEAEMNEITTRDMKLRLNDPSESWGVHLFSDLDGSKQGGHDL